MAMCTGYNFM